MDAGKLQSIIALGLVEDGFAFWTQSVYRVALLQLAQQNAYFISETFHFVILTSPRRMNRVSAGITVGFLIGI
jgi:uroporphyrinogen-III synthase